MASFGKHRRQWLVFALLAAFSLPPAAPAADDVMLVGSEYDYPPFCVVDSAGQADGFSVELLRADRDLLD